MIRPTPLLASLLLVLLHGSPAGAQAIVATHEAADQFDAIPAAMFDTVRDEFRFFYGHTSHGSQIVTGLAMLEDQDPTLYADVVMTEYGDDLGHHGDTSWVAPTRAYLDDHPECNCVMWSWCGGVSDNTEEGIDAYLAAMSQLEADYPDVVFVYMTGHLDGSGPDGNLRQRNDQIRDDCRAHGKVLFDFADIESHDPDGVWYPDEDDGCGWCNDWCQVHDCPGCDSCAHSHCFNCYRKGRAFWWMMARVAGWQAPAGTPPRAAADRPVLLPGWPNPFNPTTTVAFALPRAMRVRVTVVDGRGRLVARLADGVLAAGRHEVRWHGRDLNGRDLPSGSYVCRLESAQGATGRTLTLLK